MLGHKNNKTGIATKPQCRTRIAGFSLIELSILMVIFGGLAAASTMLGSKWVEGSEVQTTRTNLKTIEKAITAYMRLNNRLPCPADESLSPTSANFGKEANNPGTCAGGALQGTGATGEVLKGVVPFQTLGMGKNMAYDAWGNRITYYIDRRMTAENALAINPVNSTTVGDIIINDLTGNPRTTKAVYAMVSNGAKAHGAIDRRNNVVSTGSTNASELENADVDSSGNSTGVNRILVQAVPNAGFDDLVMYKKRDNLLPSQITVSKKCLAQALSWNVAGNICDSNISTLADGASIAVADNSGPYQGSVTASCNSGDIVLTSPACVPATLPCAAATVNWTVSGKNCSAAVGALTHLATSAVTDSTSPQTGAATITCNNGTLTPSATSCYNECTGTALPWLTNCSGTSTTAQHNASQLLSDPLALPSDQWSGNATATCNDGTWALSGTSCAYTNKNCTGGTQSWTISGRNCSGALAALTHGTSGSATDSSNGVPPDGIGSASYSCNDGTLTMGAATCGQSQCPASTQNWTVSGANCSFAQGVMNHSDVTTVNDTVATATGAATLTCTNGTVTQSATSCVDAPVCAAGSAESVRFRSATNTYMSRTPATNGNLKKWTVSLWTKLGDPASQSGVYHTLFSATGGVGATTEVDFFNQELRFYWNSSNVIAPTAKFSDPSKWYHLVFVWDTSNATANDRVRIYVDGNRLTTFSTNTQPALNQDSYFNGAYPNLIGKLGTIQVYDGYMDHLIAVDGQALDPTAFGEYDSNNIWVPKAFTGTYGTNGFKLEFDNASGAGTLGNDTSGNNNNFTANNFSVAANSTNDSSQDQPTVNIATLNPLDHDPSYASAVATSDGNMTVTLGGYGTVQYTGRRATIPSEGKDYYEVTRLDSTYKVANIGFAEEDAPLAGPGAGGIPYNAYVYNENIGGTNVQGGTFADGTTVATGLPKSITSGDVIMVAHDRSAKKIWFGLNGTWFGSGNPVTGASPSITYTTNKKLMPVIMAASFFNTSKRSVNFGQQPFLYRPTGYNAISAARLPTPTILNPKDHFDAITYRGNGGGQQLGNIARDSSGYQLNRSLRFKSSAQAFLAKTPSSASNQKTFTWSGWIKRGALGGAGPSLMNADPNSAFAGTYLTFSLNSPDDLGFSTIIGGSNVIRLSTARLFKDTTRWYHVIAAVDTTQAVSTDRVKLYVDGVQQTITGTYPSQNLDTHFNATYPHYIGKAQNASGGATGFFDGYMADVHFIDGQALAPTSFGEFDTKGNWVPKAYGGTYGTNGFRLDFNDNSPMADLGKDVSGNSNDWTPTNFSVASDSTNDSVIDVPTSWDDSTVYGRGNYPTLNPLQGELTTTLSDGNLKVSAPSGAQTGMHRYGTLSLKPGKWYWECTNITQGSAGQLYGVSNDLSQTTGITGARAYWSFDGTKWSDNTNSAYGATFTNNDVVGIAVNIDSGKIWFSKNGSWQASGNPVTDTNPAHADVTAQNGPWYPLVRATQGVVGSVTSCNFGQQPFVNTPPTGFKALNSQNAGTNTKYIGAPDLVWLKSRTNPTDHSLYDSQRGAFKDLASNTTSAETTQSGGVVQFNDDGILIGDLAKINSLGQNYVGWMWNEDPAAGFDIVRYTGNGVARDIVHNLGKKPAFWMIKDMTGGAGYPWDGWHQSLSMDMVIDWGSTAAAASDGGINGGIWRTAQPTTATFGVGPGGYQQINQNGHEYVAYLWSEVPGYSKFGTYTGNGASDNGPFVYTGFKPRWLLLKQRDSVNQWVLIDSERNRYNPVTLELQANANSAEIVNRNIDFLSNGFKVRDADGTVPNNNGSVVVYAAFAEKPFFASGATTSTSCGCVSPWGSTVASGGSITAYQSSTVTCGNTCASETRVCTNGTFSGTYTNQSCSVGSCACPAGPATWTVYASCSVPAGTTWIVGGQTCTAPSTLTIAHGANGTANDVTTPAIGTATYNCNDGTPTLQAGSTCRVNAVCSGTANTCTAGTPSGYSAGSCGGSKTWTCNGINGGSNAACSIANPACAPTCTDPYTGTGYATGQTANAYCCDVQCGNSPLYSPTTTTCQANGSWPDTCGFHVWGIGFSFDPNCGCGFNCFAKGTRVAMADGSFKPIEAVHIGDHVKGRTGINLVTALKPTTLGGRRLYTVNGTIKTTAEHPALTDKGWAVISREAYASEFGKALPIIIDDKGTSEMRTYGGIPPEHMREYGIGDRIAFGNEGFVEIKTLTSETLPATTPLYTLILDGDGTMQLEGGYIYTGFGVTDEK